MLSAQGILLNYLSQCAHPWLSIELPSSAWYWLLGGLGTTQLPEDRRIPNLSHTRWFTDRIFCSSKYPALCSSKISAKSTNLGPAPVNQHLSGCIEKIHVDFVASLYVKYSHFHSYLGSTGPVLAVARVHQQQVV